MNIVNILKELVGLSFVVEFEVGPLRRRHWVPSKFGQYFYCFICDAMIDNQCETQILYHICDSTLILLSGIAAFMTVNILQLPSLELQDVAKVLDWIFLVFPHYSLCASINSLYNNYAYNKACSALMVIPGICTLPNACCKGE